MRVSEHRQNRNERNRVYRSRTSGQVLYRFGANGRCRDLLVVVPPE